jgi:hypothetical protein
MRDNKIIDVFSLFNFSPISNKIALFSSLSLAGWKNQSKKLFSLILNKNKNKSSFWCSNKWPNHFFGMIKQRFQNTLRYILKIWSRKRIILFLFFGWCFIEIILNLIIISRSNNLRFVIQLNQNWKDSFIM